MYRTLRYAGFFAILILLQMLFFNNLNLTLYIYPMIYIAFVVFLPMEMAPVWVLLAGFATGALMDTATGMAGLNTIALTAMSFIRKWLIGLLAGKDVVRDGGVVGVHTLGRKRYAYFCTLFTLCYAVIFFNFQALTGHYYYLTLVKIVASTIFTVPFVMIAGALFTLKNYSSHYNG